MEKNKSFNTVGSILSVNISNSVVIRALEADNLYVCLH